MKRIFFRILIVFLPFSFLIGQVHIVAGVNVKILDISLKVTIDIISKIGFEADVVY